MTVTEVIEKLKEMPPGATVLVNDEALGEIEFCPGERNDFVNFWDLSHCEGT